MNILFRYFWVVGSIIGLANGYIYYKKLIKQIDDEKNNKHEILCLSKGYFIVLTVPFIFLQIFQILGGYKTAFYIFLFDFSSIIYCLALFVIFAFWIFIIYWIIIKDGAIILSKYSESTGRVSRNVNMIKIASLISIFGGIFSFILFSKFPAFNEAIHLLEK